MISEHWDRFAAERLFVARAKGTREYIVEHHTTNGRWDGPPCAPYLARGTRNEEAHRWSSREDAEREAEAALRSSGGAEVVSVFDAVRDQHTYVFAHGRVGQYRFGQPTGECHLWAIWLKPSKHDAHNRKQLGSIIVPSAVEAMWRDVQHAGRFKHVEVYSDPDLGDETMIVRDQHAALLGFPFLLRDVVSACEPA